jgi:hypothetical protein
MPLFYKRRQTFEARQWDPAQATDIAAWAQVGFPPGTIRMEQVFVGEVPEWRLIVGGAQAAPGDWIVRMEDGGLCVCAADRFAEAYEPVEPPAPETPIEEPEPEPEPEPDPEEEGA